MPSNYDNGLTTLIVTEGASNRHAHLDRPAGLEALLASGYRIINMDVEVDVLKAGDPVVAHFWIGSASGVGLVLNDFGNISAAATLSASFAVDPPLGTVAGGGSNVYATWVSGDSGAYLNVAVGGYTATVTLGLVTIALTSPVGGEEWRIGSAYNITWDDEYGDTVTIALYKGGVLDSTIASGVTASDESYSWAIPATVASGFDYKIRVTEDVTGFYDESSVDLTVAEEGTTETAIGCFLFGDDWDSPENILVLNGDEARATAALKAFVVTCFTQDLKAATPEGATFKGFWFRVKGTVYWEDEPDSLDLIVRFKDNEGYVGKALTAGKGTYWCPTCGWMWGGNPGATCPQCGEATELHELWTTGGGSGQTFDYTFGGTDIGLPGEAASYILPLSRCFVTDPGFGIEFEVRSSGTVGVDIPELREGFEIGTTTLTIGIDNVTVMAFYEE